MKFKEKMFHNYIMLVCCCLLICGLIAACYKANFRYDQDIQGIVVDKYHSNECDVIVYEMSTDGTEIKKNVHHEAVYMLKIKGNNTHSYYCEEKEYYKYEIGDKYPK